MGVLAAAGIFVLVGYAAIRVVVALQAVHRREAAFDERVDGWAVALLAAERRRAGAHTVAAAVRAALPPEATEGRAPGIGAPGIGARPVRPGTTGA